MIERFLVWMSPAPPDGPGHRRARELAQLRADQRELAGAIRARHALPRVSDRPKL